MSGLFNWATSAATPSEEAATPTDPDDAAATPPPLPEGEAVRRSTRACVINKNGLQIPAPDPRRVSPQERLRIRAGRATPSPSPTASASTQFEFPTPTPIMDADAIRALVQETLRASTAAAIHASTATVTEMIPEAVRTAMHGQVRDVTALTRKPDLPTFDVTNIETWIRRVENAFTRAAITNVKDKFSFIESKIGVNADPKITEFLCTNPPTDATWTNFLAYLRKRYGRTKREQINSLITGTEFDGMKPSAVCASMLEKAGRVTVDDIVKEHLYRRLPVELQRQLAQDAESMTAAELAEVADAYYDKDGRPIHSSTTTGVNTIGGGVSNAPSTPTLPQNYSSRAAAASNTSSPSSSFTAAFSMDDNNDVNAIRQRQQQKQRYNNNNNNNSRSNNNNNRNNNNNDRSTSKPSPIGANGLCHFHEKFGDDAFKCAAGCRRWSAHQAGKGRASLK